MDQWKTGFIVSHGTKLHYYRTGGSKSPLVLLHGITDDGLCWTPVAEVLANDYDVIMVDLRGHGKSDAPDQGYTYKTMAIEVAGLINGLGLESPIVMGHSMGAMTSLYLASLFPMLPKVIILEDPPALWRLRKPVQEELENRAMIDMWIKDLKRKSRDDLLNIAYSENPGWSETELNPWADSKLRFNIKITHLISSEEATPHKLSTLLEKIICPVLLITADPERRAILTDKDVVELQKIIPHVERAHISGAGHNIRRDQYSKYMVVLNQFLSKENVPAKTNIGK